MSDQADLDAPYLTASPWPVLVALGLALSETGVFLGFFVVAVAGLLLFGGSIAGILAESGHVTRAWTPLVILGVVFVGLGAVIVGYALASILGSMTVGTVLDAGTAVIASAIVDPGAVGNGIVGRGIAIVMAGTILVAMAAAVFVSDSLGRTRVSAD